MKNAKAKGSRRERQSRDILRQAGFEVIKAGGSLGIFDLVGLHPQKGLVQLVQVKSNRGVSRQERELLIAFAAKCVHVGWQVSIHRWRDRRGLQVETI